MARSRQAFLEPRGLALDGGAGGAALRVIRQAAVTALADGNGAAVACVDRGLYSVALACKGPLNARLATGVGLSFFLGSWAVPAVPAHTPYTTHVAPVCPADPGSSSRTCFLSTFLRSFVCADPGALAALLGSASGLLAWRAEGGRARAELAAVRGALRRVGADLAALVRRAGLGPSHDVGLCDVDRGWRDLWSEPLSGSCRGGRGPGRLTIRLGRVVVA
jgi:hypothetical protein